MLIVDEGRRQALVVPLWPLLVLVPGFFIHELVPWHALLVIGAVSVLALTSGVRRLRREPGTILIRGAWLRVGLDATKVAFGYRVTGAGRTTMIEVYATDGGDRVRILKHNPLGTKRAEASVNKLERTLLDQREIGPNLGARLVEEDLADLRHAQVQVEAYYASPTWKRSGYVVLAILVVFLLVMSLVVVCST